MNRTTPNFNFLLTAILHDVPWKIVHIYCAETSGELLLSFSTHSPYLCLEYFANEMSTPIPQSVPKLVALCKNVIIKNGTVLPVANNMKENSLKSKEVPVIGKHCYSINIRKGT